MYGKNKECYSVLNHLNINICKIHTYIKSSLLMYQKDSYHTILLLLFYLRTVLCIFNTK